MLSNEFEQNIGVFSLKTSEVLCIGLKGFLNTLKVF